MILPSERYQQDVREGRIQADTHQIAILKKLDVIYSRVIKREKKRKSTLGKIRRTIKPRPPVKGMYLWGTVGIGKTFMMDLFYDHLPVKKQRLHFHNFMRELHRQLKEHKGIKDPLKHIAKEIADNCQIICFDEFFVTNITDAMLLRKLFEYLFQYGLCLVTTSNTPPDDLYSDGLQREQFLPAITLIKKHTETIHMISEKDYRLQHICQTGVYFTPNNTLAEKNLDLCFKHFSHSKTHSNNSITINQRRINIIKQNNETIWFDFYDICQPPRSQDDYLDISKKFNTIIISNVPQIKKHDNNSIILFINLVDVLYDTKKRVIISAETDIEDIYTEGRKTFDFNRTRSRLIEMNSEEYFNSENTITHSPNLESDD
jgi:cell division protein ZapE